jgi:preprotein translocase subunit YajC
MTMFKLMMMAGVAAGLPAAVLAQAAPAPAASTPAAAPAAASGTLAAGAAVKDTSGGSVGTIESVDGDFATVATAKNKVRLPKTAFAMRDGGAVIGMTAAQLDQAAAQAAPAAPQKAEVAQGKSVTDMQGAAVGSITEADQQFATLQLTSGSKVRLPVTAFGVGTNGSLRVAMSAAQLSAAAGAAPSGGAAPAGNPTSGGAQ